MSSEDEYKQFYKEMSYEMPETTAARMENLIPGESRYKERVIDSLVKAMREATLFGDETIEFPYREPTAEEEVQLLVMEEWLEENGYTFDISSEWEAGKRVVSLYVLLWSD